MVQYSNRTKLSPVRKNDTILKQWQNLLTVRKTWYNTQSQNLSPVRKRWYKTETVQKSVTSQKKMVQYSNRAKTCQQSEKDGTILKQSQTLSPVRKRWYNTQTVPKPANSQKR